MNHPLNPPHTSNTLIYSLANGETLTQKSKFGASHFLLHKILANLSKSAALLELTNYLFPGALFGESLNPDFSFQIELLSFTPSLPLFSSCRRAPLTNVWQVKVSFDVCVVRKLAQKLIMRSA